MITTIKVDETVRDRLKAQAVAAGVTIGEHLARLADRADRDARREDWRRAVASTPPGLMDSYAEETAWWDHASDD